YVNIDSTTTQPKLSITTGSATSARNYQIKVSYIECNNPMRAPSGCLQYFTGTSGTMQSYNFGGGVQLQNQRYLLCIRRKTGFCGFQLTESQTSAPDPFNLFPAINTVLTSCTMNFVRAANNHFAASTIAAIVGGAATPITVNIPQGDDRCGGVFGAINGETTPGALQSSPGSPFFVEYFVADANLAGTQTGFSLDFVQTPCM
ncbi:hypothetical protein TCAL_12359, partial [Tigriopus californicus]